MPHEIELAKLRDIMFKAYWLREALDCVPVKFSVNSQGKEFVKPDTFNSKLPKIKKAVKSFAADIKSLPFDIPLFDDDMFCTKSAIINSIDRGLYNLAALCYNKALLTTYQEIEYSYSKDIALLMLTDVRMSGESDAHTCGSAT